MANETTHTPGEWTPARILNLAEASEVEFAVRACNAHDDLVAALKALAIAARETHLFGGPELRHANAALAKAGEK